MIREDLLLRAKLIPPPLHRRALLRPRLAMRLRAALEHRLTLIQAGPGFGKTTALAALAEAGFPLFWYSLDPGDGDPRQFLAYLITAFRLHLPGLSDVPLALLGELGAGERLTPVIDALTNALSDALTGPAVLVLDDAQVVAESPELLALTDRFISYQPVHLHVILSSRYGTPLPGLVRWRARGEVLEIGRTELTFTLEEIEALFRERYAVSLTPREVAVVARRTEGWPIALQMIGQGLARRPVAVQLDHWLAQAPEPLTALFDYLAADVLAHLPADLASFLRDTAVLRELTPAACDAVTERSDSGRMLGRLVELDLFIYPLGEGRFRYHHLFHDFLIAQAAADPAAVTARHRRAASFFAAVGNYPEAIYHFMAAGSHDEAAQTIEAAGEAVLHAGRLDTLAGWIDSLPPTVVAERPLLQAYLGDLYRLRSRFEEALAWYAAAEQHWRRRGDTVGIVRALRGQALVYLDTVRPAEAESLLEQALHLTDGAADRAARVRLLELLAENKLNMGRPAEAEALREEAQALREADGGSDILGVRVKLRTGRLDDAIRTLHSRLMAERNEEDRGITRPPRGHRETVLLLSLLHALRGDGAEALAFAREGIALGERLGSPYVTAVGYIRMGHAWQLARLPVVWASDGEARSRPYVEAIRCYQTAIALSDRLAVRRVRAEALWGLTRAYGCLPTEGGGRGDLQSAQQAMAEGAAIGRGSGDLWVAALCELALGAGYVLGGRQAEGVEVATRALIAFRETGDTFGRAAARLWLALAYHDLRQGEHLAFCLEDLLALCETHGYDFLLTAGSLHGPPDQRRVIPLLLEALNRRKRPAYVGRLLAQLGLADLEVHPGYQLVVQTLGGFRVWRGDVEVTSREWQRDKARQLFQLFLTERGRWLQREAILDCLWRDAAPEAAIGGFKVALNALNKALEPGHQPDAPFAFIERNGTAYRLRPTADLRLDAAEFVRECETGLRLAADAERREEAIGRLRAGLELYRGDYLPDALYEDWAGAERERLLSLYLRTADRLADLLIAKGQLDEALQVCQEILARDPCWERAYYLMMLAYARRGNRDQVLKTYNRCVAVLRQELDAPPSEATEALYRQLIAPTSPA